MTDKMKSEGAKAAPYPAVRLGPKKERRLLTGHPWVFSNEIAMTPDARALPKGCIVALEDGDGKQLALATFNPHTLIAGRILTRDLSEAIDGAFIARRIARALALRERLYDAPFYRLVHAEADGLPGLVIDRYGDVLVCQFNTAGMEQLRPHVLSALEEVLSPDTILSRSDSPARRLEGLEDDNSTLKGETDGRVELVENGCRFFTDLAAGQKTGWFFDHRNNRTFMASLAKGARVLDLYSYAGAFTIPAAVAGATSVTAVDRSAPALDLAAASARANGVEDICSFHKGDVFASLEHFGRTGEKFNIVIADPPAFVKSRKDLKAGSRGYRKLTRLAAATVEKAGFLLVASCSHNMPIDLFTEQVARGINDAGRTGRILRISGAGADHPVHPMLPESAYLKAMVLELD